MDEDRQASLRSWAERMGDPWSGNDQAADAVLELLEDHEGITRGLLYLHRPRHVSGVAGQTNDVTYCKECSHVWPCRSAQLVGIPEEQDDP